MSKERASDLPGHSADCSDTDRQIYEQELQDFMMCSYAPRLLKEEGLIDWTLPAVFIHNRVRGLYPWPHAYTYLNGALLIVLKTCVKPVHTDAVPGTIVDVLPDAIHVATGHQGRVVIQDIQLDGRRAMAVRDFLAGHRVERGNVFTGPPVSGSDKSRRTT